MLPATRITNRSPSPWSNTSSAGTRASEQPRMIANGCLLRGERAPPRGAVAVVAALLVDEALVALAQRPGVPHVPESWLVRLSC